MVGGAGAVVIEQRPDLGRPGPGLEPERPVEQDRPAFLRPDLHAIGLVDQAARVEGVAEETILIPRTDWVLQPLLAIIPLQLLAYHVARLNGLNVDQPRNLAKTVTVE